MKRIVVTVFAMIALIASSAAPVSAHDEDRPHSHAEDLVVPDDMQEPLDDAFIGELRGEDWFAGAWVDEDRTITIAVVGGEAPVREFETSEKIELVTGFEHSYKQLVAAVDDVAAASSDGVAAYVDERSNELVVEVVRGKTFATELDVTVRTEQVEEAPSLGHGSSTCTSAANCDDARANTAIVVTTFGPFGLISQDCTSGGIVKAGSDRFILTARHCAGNNEGAVSWGYLTINGYTVADFWVESGFAGDSALFKLRQEEISNRHLSINDTGGYYDIGSWDPVLTVGETVCAMNRNNGGTPYGFNCGSVHSTNAICSGSTTGLTRVRSGSTFSTRAAPGMGDSGGATWGNGQHRGIYTCTYGFSGAYQDFAMVSASKALADVGYPISAGNADYLPHHELRNRNFDRSTYWSDWSLGGSGQRARYAHGGFDNAWTTEFNCFTAGCSIYQDSVSGAQGYNSGESFTLSTYMRCGAWPSCSTTLAMWVDPNGSPTLVGATSVTLPYLQWTLVELNVTLPSGTSASQARYEVYNNAVGQNIRFSQPAMGRT